MSTLNERELGTMTDADRAMFDAAVQAIPPEFDPVFTALMLSNRAIVRHDMAGIKTAIDGYAELLDSSDAKARELVEAARQLQAATKTVIDMQVQTERRLTTVEGEREQFRQFMDKSSRDRAGIRDEIRALRRLTFALSPFIVGIALRSIYVIVEGLWGVAMAGGITLTALLISSVVLGRLIYGALRRHMAGGS